MAGHCEGALNTEQELLCTSVWLAKKLLVPVVKSNFVIWRVLGLPDLITPAFSIVIGTRNGWNPASLSGGNHLGPP